MTGLVEQLHAAGEGNAAGLHAGVGVRALEVDVAGPVLVALHPAALELERQQSSSCMTSDLPAAPPLTSPLYDL